MKRAILFSLILGMVLLTNCTKDCEPVTGTCLERPPTNEICDAYFSRWFYNQEKNQCEQIGYSGCSQNGFATREDCENCQCR